MPSAPTLRPFSSTNRPSPPLRFPSVQERQGQEAKTFALPPPPSPPHPPPPLRRLHPRGIGGIAFAAVVFRCPPRNVAVFRCGRAEDTLRTFRTKSLAGGKDGVVARPKVLGFVGVRPASPHRSPSRTMEYLVPFPSGWLRKPGMKVQAIRSEINISRKLMVLPMLSAEVVASLVIARDDRGRDIVGEEGFFLLSFMDASVKINYEDN